MNTIPDDVLIHHGILGMKWGVRRYQNPDGTLTAAGLKRYNKKKKVIDDAVSVGDKKTLKKYEYTIDSKDYKQKYDTAVNKGVKKAIREANAKSLKSFKDDISKADYEKSQKLLKFKKLIDDSYVNKSKNFQKRLTKQMNKLMSEIAPEDLDEATRFINSRNKLLDAKIEELKKQSSAMAKIDKVSNDIKSVSDLTKNTSDLIKNTSNIAVNIAKFGKEEKKKKKNNQQSGNSSP